MEANIIQFIPRPNPLRDEKALELRNVALVAQPPLVHTRALPDDPSEYAMDDDDSPYVAPDSDSA